MNMVWLKMGLLRPDWAVIGHGAELAGLCGWPLMALLAAWLWRAGRSLALAQQQLRGDLARIFEQLDLLRLDAQQPALPALPTLPTLPVCEARPVVPAGANPAARISMAAAPASRDATAAPASHAAAPEGPTHHQAEACDYHAAARLAARGGSAAEIAERCGLVGGEARVLVALQQARERRAEAA